MFALADERVVERPILWLSCAVVAGVDQVVDFEVGLLQQQTLAYQLLFSLNRLPRLASAVAKEYDFAVGIRLPYLALVFKPQLLLLLADQLLYISLFPLFFLAFVGLFSLLRELLENLFFLLLHLLLNQSLGCFAA